MRLLDWVSGDGDGAPRGTRTPDGRDRKVWVKRSGGSLALMKKLQPSPSLACLGRASAFMVISDSVLVAHQCGSGPPPKPPPPLQSDARLRHGFPPLLPAALYQPPTSPRRAICRAAASRWPCTPHLVWSVPPWPPPQPGEAAANKLHKRSALHKEERTIICNFLLLHPWWVGKVTESVGIWGGVATNITYIISLIITGGFLWLGNSFLGPFSPPPIYYDAILSILPRGERELLHVMSLRLKHARLSLAHSTLSSIGQLQEIRIPSWFRCSFGLEYLSLQSTQTSTFFSSQW